MTTIAYDFEPGVFGALRLSPAEFAREMRIAAAVQWYAQGRVSQGRAAEIADPCRAEFINVSFFTCRVSPKQPVFYPTSLIISAG
ncbi:MAG: UPF0175 family protein [Methylococcales bacterium]